MCGRVSVCMHPQLTKETQEGETATMGMDPRSGNNGKSASTTTRQAPKGNTDAVTCVALLLHDALLGIISQIRHVKATVLEEEMLSMTKKQNHARTKKLVHARILPIKDFTSTW